MVSSNAHTVCVVGELVFTTFFRLVTSEILYLKFLLCFGILTVLLSTEPEYGQLSQQLMVTLLWWSVDEADI